MPCLVPFDTVCQECGLRYRTKLHCRWTNLSQAFTPGRQILCIGENFECRTGVHCLFDIGPLKQGTCLTMSLYKENQKLIVELFRFGENIVYSFERACPGEEFVYKGVENVDV